MTFSETTGGALAAALVAFALTWIVGFVVRLFNAPVELYRERDEEASSARQQLYAISTERRLVFSEPVISFRQPRQSIVDCSISLAIENTGETLLRYKLQKVSVRVNGRDVTPAYTITSDEILIHAGRTELHTLPPISNVMFRSFPIEIIVEAVLEYDNQPTLQSRVTGRTVRRDYTSIMPIMFRQYIIAPIES